MTHPDDRVTAGRFPTQRFRAPDRVTLMVVFVDALIIVFVFAFVIGRSGAGGSSATLSAGGPQAFDAPVTLPADGEYVRSRVLASGDLEVEHWVRSTTPIYRLTLSLPRALRSGGEGVFASRVKVLANGVAEYGPTTVGMTREWYHPQGASTLTVRYVLSGALERRGSAPGRALLRATSLDLKYPLDRGPRVVSVTGAKVLTAACSYPRGTASARPCGAPEGLGWRVHLRQSARHDAVLVQLDLT